MRAVRESVQATALAVVLPAVRWIRRRIGFRGGSLIFFGTVDVALAYGLTDIPAATARTPFYQVLVSVAPLSWWAVLWWATALVTIASAVRARDMPGFVASAAMLSLWSSLSLVTYWWHDSPRSWLLAALYGVLAAFVIMEAFRDDEAAHPAFSTRNLISRFGPPPEPPPPVSADPPSGTGEDQTQEGRA